MVNSCRLYLIIGACLVAPILDLHAQRHRYMDSSGNIRFVDSLNDVPRQYRQQLVPPTPTPVLNQRQRLEVQRAKEREYQERLRQAERKKRELERVRKAMERDQRLRGGRANGVVAPAQEAAPKAERDRIDVIR